MPTSIDKFKAAFAGNGASDDFKAHDRNFAKALEELDRAMAEVGGDGASDDVRKKLVERYQEARGQTGKSAKDKASRLDEVLNQTQTVTAKLGASGGGKKSRGGGKKSGGDQDWSINPDGAPPKPDFSKPGSLLPKLSPEFIEQLMEEDRKKREKKLKEAQDACKQARKWLEKQPKKELHKLTYPGILAAIKEKFPKVADLPKPKMLMDMVEDVLRNNGFLLEAGLNDKKKFAMEQLVAAYIAALPSNIQAVVANGGIRLVMKGVAAKPADGKDKKGEKFEFKNKHFTIEVANQAWKALDPSLRNKWKSLNAEASDLEKLLAKLDSLKKEWKSAKDDGSSTKHELEAQIKKLTAQYKGRWDTLQKSIETTAKLTTDGIKATLTETKKKVKDTKVGAELELKFKEMEVGLKAFANTPDLKTALKITGSAEKITASIEAEAVKTGTVITIAYEKALKEVNEQLKIQVKQGKTKIAATLSKKAVELEDKLKKLKDAKTKDFKDVKALEDGLEKLQIEVLAEFTAGNFKVAVGGKASSDGEVGGKVKVELMLKDGISFLGKGQKISFSADVSTKGYKFELMFSVGDMPDLKDVHKANEEADKRIRELYDLVSDTKIRSMDDAKKIQEAFSKVMKPLKKSVEAMKKVDKKKFAVEVGVTLTGDLPSGGKMPPPVAGFGLKVTF